jgi:hypothetical protein
MPASKLADAALPAVKGRRTVFAPPLPGSLPNVSRWRYPAVAQPDTDERIAYQDELTDKHNFLQSMAATRMVVRVKREEESRGAAAEAK